MAILIGCENGLHAYIKALHRLPCPLSSVDVLSQGGFAAVSVQDRLLWDGRRLLAVDPGIEAVLWWHGHLLTLSSETDSLTLIDGHTGLPVTLAPAGVYPQHMCLSAPDTVAVCGGADSTVRILALPSLSLLAQHRLPGSTARILPQPDAFTVLSTVENGDLHCLVSRISLRSGRCESLALLPGLPGAIAADMRGGIWIAAGETLYRLPHGSKTPESTAGGFGLISSLAETPQGLLICDPVLAQCCLLRGGNRETICTHVLCAASW